MDIKKRVPKLIHLLSIISFVIALAHALYGEIAFVIIFSSLGLLTGIDSSLTEIIFILKKEMIK